MRALFLALALLVIVPTYLHSTGISNSYDKSLSYDAGDALSQDQKSDKFVPTVDKILDNYVRALGGRAAIEQIRTMVRKGECETAMGVARVTAYLKAPNNTLTVIDLPDGSSHRTGCDGPVVWVDDPIHGLTELTGPRQKPALRECAFPQSIRFRELFKKIEFRRLDTVNGRDTYVLEATAEDGLVSEHYFDTQTGLELRWDTELYTENYETFISTRFILDYEDINGVKFPRTVYETSPSGHATFHIQESHMNVPIDDSVFAMPRPGSVIKGKSEHPM